MWKAVLAFVMMSGTAGAADIRVIDGDGFRMDGKEIRIWGIDAPELTQTCRNGFWWSYPCGKRSKAFLRQILRENAPVCQTITIDRYGRHISRCKVKGRDLGALMVKSGWALDFERFSRGAYAAEQMDAKQKGRGLWQGRFTPPWEWRDQHR